MGISARMQHFRFCYGCVQSRKEAGRLSVAQAAKLKFCALTGTEPNDTFLDECFPKAAEARRKLAQENHLDEWDPETIRLLWHYQHNTDHTGNCTVRFGEVVTIFNDKSELVRVRVDSEDVTVVCTNPFHPNLKEGDLVAFHQLTIAEVTSLAK